MLKYTDTQVVFQELPNETTLAINISGCKNNCIDCHSSYLQQNIGTELTNHELVTLLKNNVGCTAVCFMGGSHDCKRLNELFRVVRSIAPELKCGVYFGSDIRVIHLLDFWLLDYIKVGAYIKELGPLNNPSTNQRLYRIEKFCQNNRWHYYLNDITNCFWNGVSN